MTGRVVQTHRRTTKVLHSESFHSDPHLQPKLCPAPVTPLGVVPEGTMPGTDQKLRIIHHWKQVDNL